MLLRRVAKWLAICLALLLGLGLVAYWRSDNDCGKRGAPGANAMKAMVYCDYGTAEVLKFEDVAKPSPGADEILVRVRAASVNPLDWHYLRGTPYFMRLEAGLRKPKDTRLGVDFAGTIEAVGANVKRFKVGDDVFGGRTGAFAEYVCLPESRAVVLKPAAVSFEQAAAMPIAALTALQGLRDKGKVRAGQKVLVNGASGGVGTFAVQIAKSLGADVTGVCSGRNADLVRSLGADRVIDYTKEDFTISDERYDVILDLVGNRSPSECRRVMTPKGRLVIIGGGGPDAGKWIGPMIGPLKAMVQSWFVSQEMGMLLAKLNREDLTTVAESVQAGKLKPVIDRTYPLAQVPEAIRYVEQGHARGKVIIKVE